MQEINTNIYNFLKLIPKWKVITYKKLWEIFWVHPRFVWKLMAKNAFPNEFPCYKVVCTNWTMWGYIFGLKKKQALLEQNWIIFENWKIDKKYFYEPKQTNFFLWLWFELSNIIKFQKLIFELKNYFDKKDLKLNFQNPLNPHITIYFLWNLVDVNKSNINFFFESQNIFKKDEQIVLTDFWNFENRVFFLYNKSNNLNIKFQKFYKWLIDILWIKSNELFYHHLTLFKSKQNIDLSKYIDNNFFEILNKNEIVLKINKLIFYSWFDNNFQIPIIDFINSNFL